MIFQDFLLDYFKYKCSCHYFKPNFNIFNVVKRNLGANLAIDWLILNCFDQILETLSNYVINYKDEYPFDNENVMVDLGWDYTIPFIFCSMVLLFLSWLIPYVQVNFMKKQKLIKVHTFTFYIYILVLCF